MTPVEGPVGHPYVQSDGDLARKQVILEALGTPRADIEGVRVRRKAEKRLELDDHPLAPATGIINGLRLSAVLWGFILLSVVLVW